MIELTLIGILSAATELAANDPITVLAGVLGTLLLGVNGAQSFQLSGIRSELHAHREAQDKRMKDLEDRLEELEANCGDDEPLPRSRKKITGSHSTSRGRAPRDTSIRESGSRKRPQTQPGDLR